MANVDTSKQGSRESRESRESRSSSNNSTQGLSATLGEAASVVRDEAGRIIEEGSEAFRSRTRGLEESFRKGVDGAIEYYDQAGDFLGDTLKAATKSIKRNPVQAVLVGVAAGCVLGLLLSTRRSE